MSGFDSYVVSNKIPQMRNVVNSVKIGAGIVSLKIFNGCVNQNKNVPQYVHIRCGRLHINSSLSKTGTIYKLQPLLLKQEMNHDDIYEDTWENKEDEQMPYLKNDVFSTVFSYVRYIKSMEEITGFGMKSSLRLYLFSKEMFYYLKRWNRWTYLQL